MRPCFYQIDKELRDKATSRQVIEPDVAAMS